jgi:hypothetical protein
VFPADQREGLPLVHVLGGAELAAEILGQLAACIAEEVADERGQVRDRCLPCPDRFGMQDEPGRVLLGRRLTPHAGDAEPVEVIGEAGPPRRP